ncbi:winged helix-turn-helix transcriptional regulator [Catenulispora pinisilvae]|uniref:winged helix-turn-helix transcriptional regulator n=1 Tax=Catenulispora pinisilvae TaxID=2705253 RepID=UPI001890F8C4|nr:helix-turn-helix domain-containing protein [Catenulispora pinisilvae]
MRLTSLSEMNCSIARTLDVVGEWWTLLIVRDALRGATRFDEFRESLGMARGVLSSRLHKLVDQGILERRQYLEHPPRYEYTLTEKGRALAPLIRAMMNWGDTWAAGPSGPPVVLIHEPCGHTMQPLSICPHCRAEVHTDDVLSTPGPGATSPEAKARLRTSALGPEDPGA